ncbi:MAG: hypothetical protein KAR05_10555 [Candidatus Omnitrophica bacterium]|nr:hypothetical protein [Candidatus Omnitrophota bacterium]
MDIYEHWEKALKSTEIIRPRVQGLDSFENTLVPYILLSESSINIGDTVVRQGEVMVQRPSLLLPPNVPQFEGFDFDIDEAINKDTVINFLLVRGIQFPSLRYNNHTCSLDVYEGRLSEAIKHHQNKLQQRENVRTGLIVAPEDCWQFSLLIFICSQIARNADQDISKLLNEYKKRDKT